MKTAFSDMLGNSALRTRLREDILADRLSHAYILEGASGFGKHMLAMRIAAALSCEKKTDGNTPLPCMECPACRKILSGNSPDVIPVNRGDKATLGVEAIRSMHSDVYIAPNELEHKIYIICDAHLMTVQAQNAFLLTLEEPPPYVCFLLLCDSVAPLLETVRSRAPTLRLQPIQPEEIADHLCRIRPEAKRMREQSPAELNEIAISANGSMGEALTLLDPKQRKPITERRAAAKELVRLCGAKRNSAVAIGFLNGLGQKREDLLAFFNTALYCIRDLLSCKHSETAPLCFYTDREEATEVSYRFSAPELICICDAITETSDRLRRNANVRLTLTDFARQTGLLS